MTYEERRSRKSRSSKTIFYQNCQSSGFFICYPILERVQLIVIVHGIGAKLVLKCFVEKAC